MSTAKPRALIAIEYAEYAHEYLRSLPPEHFMEATSQATQRKITLESLDLVHARRPEVQVFNELLVQYPRARQRRPGQVVPDNMVVLCEQPIKAEGSYDLPLQPVGPFWMLEYVSKHNKRKDYEDNFDKYELELKVPYFLLFYPENQELTLYEYNGKKYVSVKPNENARYAIPRLDLEVALLDGWIRFWFRGELLPLPGELLDALNEARTQLKQQKRRSDQESRRADEETRRAQALEREVTKLRAQLEKSARPHNSK